MNNHRESHPQNPYVAYDPDDLILRDQLAVDRTALANERTLLAYFRTGLTLFVGGVTFVKFFQSYLVEIIGWGFIALSIPTTVIGVARYIHMRRLMHRIRRTPD